MNIVHYDPMEIEKKSFEIITEMLGEKVLDEKTAHIVKRCIHTSADFDYADSLYFSENAVDAISSAFKSGCTIITDTQMAKSGINKANCDKLGITVECFIGDEDVREEALKNGQTRATTAVLKASKLDKPLVFAVGNAPTALIKLYELSVQNGFCPLGIIGVPVGFVNVVESKELIMKTDIPCIVAKGRKGGSNIAAAICNAIIQKLV